MFGLVATVNQSENVSKIFSKKILKSLLTRNNLHNQGLFHQNGGFAIGMAHGFSVLVFQKAINYRGTAVSNLKAFSRIFREISPAKS